MKKQYIIALSIVVVLAVAFIALYAYMHHPRTDTIASPFSSPLSRSSIPTVISG